MKVYRDSLRKDCSIGAMLQAVQRPLSAANISVAYNFSYPWTK